MVARVAHRLSASAPARQRGFTLIELMATVVIVGILAALATIGVRRYILASKASEATHMIAAIEAAQEQYKSETFSYLDVSLAHNLDDNSSFYPLQTPLAGTKTAWGGASAKSGVDAKWRELGVSSDAPVYYAYGCAAGATGSDIASPPFTITGFPSGTAQQPWYLVEARGDLDGDSQLSYFVGTSATAQIFQGGDGDEQ